MRLYYFPVAPNPTRVRLVLAEKEAAGTRLGIEEVVVNLREGGQKTPEHLARNPLGRLPVLELEDGSFLSESVAIVELLEELFPDPPLLASDPVARARVRELERISDLGVLQPVARVVHATNSPLGLPPNPGIAELFRGVLDSHLSLLENVLSDGRRFLVSDDLSAADCTLAAALQFARFGKLEIALGPGLARWNAAYRERPAAKKVLNL